MAPDFQTSHLLPRCGRFLLLAALLGLVLLLAAGCGRDNDDVDGSTPEATPPADATAIRQVDAATLPDVQTTLRQLGSGAVKPTEVLYADLTGDGREEAIVPISSGGTLGNIAFLVFTLKSGSPALILTRTLDRSSAGGLRVTVEDGRLVETVGEFGPEDPLCCPSKLRKTTFRWDGSRLQVEREERISTGGSKQ